MTSPDVAAGTAPALKAARADVNTALRQGGSNVAVNPHARMTLFLVTAQITLSCVVLIGSGWIARSVLSLRDAELGADTDGIFTSRIGLFPTDYPDSSDRLRFYETLQERLSALPEADAATLSTSLPGAFAGYREVVPEGLDPGENRQFAQVLTVAPNYFDMFGVQVLAGRPFRETDRSDNLPVALVNRMFTGLLLSLGFARLLSSILYGVMASSPSIQRPSASLLPYSLRRRFWRPSCRADAP